MTPGAEWRAIENALMSFIKEAVNLESVFTLGKGPQPNRPFVSLAWLSIDGVGDSGYTETYNAAKRKVEKNYYASRQAQLDIQVITDDSRAGNNALAYADAIAVAFDISELSDKWLEPVNVAVADYGTVRVLDASEDAVRPVSRAIFTVKLNMAVNVESAVTPNSIESVRISSTLDGSSITAGGAMTVSGS